MNADNRIIYEEIDVRLSPADAYIRLRKGSEASFLLESSVGSERTVAYSFLGASPEKVLHGEGGLDSVKDVMDSRSCPSPFPFMGGLVGYFSYHLVNHIEPDLNVKEGDYPVFELGLYDRGLIYDHSEFKVYCFHPRDDLEYKDKLLEVMKGVPEEGELFIGAVSSSTGKEEYCDGVSALHDNILDGEVFQTVLSGYEEHSFEGDPFVLYRNMRKVNPSPYMYYLDFGERKVLGSSPETLVTVKNDEVTTYPIAGTRPLGTNIDERRINRNEMIGDEKERAEHIMLVDLARNDIGKVSEFGSVEVTEFMRVEEYSHVQHMVSKVRGKMREDVGPVDALCAMFPAGTVSGAPKHRSMRLIEKYEGRARGPYAGAVGYISDSGGLDTAITIRSAFVDGDRISFQAGAGIVLDSDPEREYQECGHKLGALHRSAELCRGNVQ